VLMEAPNLPTFFKGASRRPRGLRYKPRYYDADKEAYENKKAKILGKMQGREQEAAINALNMERRISNSRFRRKVKKNNSSQMIRLIIILVLLIGISAYVLQIFDFLK